MWCTAKRCEKNNLTGEIQDKHPEQLANSAEKEYVIRLSDKEKIQGIFLRTWCWAVGRGALEFIEYLLSVSATLGVLPTGCHLIPTGVVS